MKKLFAFIKTKDNTEKNSLSDKKSLNKEDKALNASSVNHDNSRELFSDDYHDIGYC